MKNKKPDFVNDWGKFPVNYRFLDCSEVEDKSTEEKGVSFFVSEYKTKSYPQYSFYKNISKLV